MGAVRNIRTGSIVLSLALSAAFSLPLIAIISPPRLITAPPLEAIALKVLAPFTSVLLVPLLGRPVPGGCIRESPSPAFYPVCYC